MLNYIYADFVSRLNNAKSQRFKYIKVRNSNKIVDTLKIFVELGVVTNFTIIDYKTIAVVLKYKTRRSVFKKLKLVSVPSRRVYADLVRLAKLKNKSNTCFYILSTGKGLKTDTECYIEKLGGEILLKVEL